MSQDLFAVRFGQPGSLGVLVPAIFTDYDAAEAEATIRRRGACWACVQQIESADDELELEHDGAAIELARLRQAGEALAECLEFALETHIYEPGEVPPDSGELLALEAWRRVIAPAPIARRDNVEYHQGGNARRDGEPESANPFTASSDPDSRHARWALGWKEAAPAAELELTVAPQPVPIGPPAYEEEPEAERTGAYRVRFYKQTTTTDRHSIAVRASSPEAARDRVEAWGTGKIELTEAEELTDELEREEGIDASEFSQLEEEGDPYAVVELEAAELA
jgi:hypothetical protein